MHYLADQRIVAPGYSIMQDTVGGALVHEQRRLASIVRSHLTLSDHAALKALLGDSQGLYEITLLKRDPRDFSKGEIKSEIGRGDRMRPVYHLAQKLLPHLKHADRAGPISGRHGCDRRRPVGRFRNVTLKLSTRFATVSFEIRSEHSWKPIKRRIA